MICHTEAIEDIVLVMGPVMRSSRAAAHAFIGLREVGRFAYLPLL